VPQESHARLFVWLNTRRGILDEGHRCDVRQRVSLARLTAVIERYAPLRPDHIAQPLPQRLPRDPAMVERILSAHRAAVENGDPVYIDPLTKRSVMTAVFLASRGRCCSSGCRHCPYEP
jgi:hypothetical protein